jgi:hypothetical protein
MFAKLLIRRLGRVTIAVSGIPGRTRRRRRIINAVIVIIVRHLHRCRGQ